MFHEALAAALKAEIPHGFQEFAELSPSSPAFEEAYHEYFVGKGELNRDKLNFGYICLLHLAELGQEFPEAYDDTLTSALNQPDFRVLAVADLFDEAFSRLAEPRCSMLQEQLYRACLHGLFRFGSRVAQGASAYKAQLTDDLQDAFAQASKQPDVWGLEFALLPGERFSPAQGAQLLLRLHDDAKDIDEDYTEEDRTKAEELLHISLEALTKRAMAEAAAGNYCQSMDATHDGPRWLLATLPENVKEALLMSQPRLLWHLLHMHPTLKLTTFAIRNYAESHAGLETIEGADTLRSHIDKQYQNNHNPHWKAAAIAVFPEASKAVRGQLFTRITGWQHATQSTALVPELLPLFDTDDERMRLYICERLYAMPLDEAHPLVEAQYHKSSDTGKAALLRVYTVWAWLEDRADLLDALVAQESSPTLEAAFDTAQARTTPDWHELWLSYNQWLQGKEAFASPHRQQELLALVEPLIGRNISLETLLSGIRHEPLLLYSFLRRTSEGYYTGYFVALEQLKSQYKEAFAEAAKVMLRHDSPAGLTNLYQFAAERGVLSAEVHAHWAVESKGKLQKLAGQQLAAAGEEALPYCLELLKAKKADTRMAGIRALHLLGLAEAVVPLEAALQKERSKKCKQALEEAIAHCKEGDESQDIGVYTRADSLDESGALQQLREILYEPGTLETWVRTCDVLSRVSADESAAFGVCLDYLKGHGVEHWKDKLRVVPWDWGGKDVSGIAQATDTWFATASYMFKGEYAPFLDEALSQLEIKQHGRKLPRSLIPEFLDWVEVAWRWCEQNKIPLAWLEARLDGGSYNGASRPGATHLSLWNHFGFVVERGPAFSGYSAGEGIRWIKINLPPGHAFRDMYPLRGGNRYLDLRDIMTLEEAQKELGIS